MKRKYWIVVLCLFVLLMLGFYYSQDPATIMPGFGFGVAFGILVGCGVLRELDSVKMPVRPTGPPKLSVVRKTGTNGFTLPEILVVIAIIGILATIAISPIRDIAGRKDRAKLVRMTRNVAAEVAPYAAEHGNYANIKADCSNLPIREWPRANLWCLSSENIYVVRGTYYKVPNYRVICVGGIGLPLVCQGNES